MLPLRFLPMRLDFEIFRVAFASGEEALGLVASLSIGPSEASVFGCTVSDGTVSTEGVWLVFDSGLMLFGFSGGLVLLVFFNSWFEFAPMNVGQEVLELMVRTKHQTTHLEGQWYEAQH